MLKCLLKVSLLFVFHLSLVCADEITIVADEWCPYNCVPGSDKPGYVVEIATLVFARKGHHVVYKTESWNRTLIGVRKGVYNGAIAATTEELPEGVFPENNLGFYGNYFVVRADSDWRYESLSSLSNVKLGVIKDYNYGENINSYIQRSPLVFVKSGTDAVKKNLGDLYRGIIDVYLEDHNVANYEAKQLRFEKKLKLAGSEGEPIALYIGFTPQARNSLQYAQILSEGISEIRSSGELEAILAEYGLNDWQ